MECRDHAKAASVGEIWSISPLYISLLQDDPSLEVGVGGGLRDVYGHLLVVDRQAREATLSGNALCLHQD